MNTISTTLRWLGVIHTDKKMSHQLHKMQIIYWLNEQIVVSQGLSSVDSLQYTNIKVGIWTIRNNSLLHCFGISKPGDLIKQLSGKLRCFGRAAFNLFFHLAGSQGISMQPNTRYVWWGTLA